MLLPDVLLADEDEVTRSEHAGALGLMRALALDAASRARRRL
jgi:hypothetical protein